jgi:hypothetical protein
MADITDHNEGSPSALDDHTVGNGNSIGDARGIKRQRQSTADDDDDDDDKPGRERRKIEIKFITDKSRRHITFSKRKAGIMKKVRLFDPNARVVARADRVSRIATDFLIGIRTVCPHWHPSPSSCRLRDWFGLHLHNPQAPTLGHQGRGQEFDPGKHTEHSIPLPQILS